jgi:hypothetical protein
MEKLKLDAETDAGNPVSDMAEGIVQDTVLDTVDAAQSQYTEAEYKKVLRKIDLVLLPLMWLCYGTQQADKTSISTQATFGMREDTGLVGQQFSCKGPLTA